ncbi:hypothetical protein FF011L_53720 [Roseimaritima multifibrata]|uniref:Uncharacterized protein n=1 Tax=Roseimaritima multifibrata TaxID=1930274 RepID=A0A517MNV1_9BACT|nr:hypothetical protein [Roseimaritima multifibrata]QDS96560.1 hypothetical protein FF011L_53720 [Roseimaritima multifibrata]
MVAFSDHHDNSEQAQDPSPEEIRIRAREVRDRWSERTRKRRRAKQRPGWSVPTIQIGDVSAAIEHWND